MTINGYTAATQQWTQSNASFAYTSPLCYVSVNFQLGNNSLTFYANNTVPEAQIGCTNGTSGTVTSGVLSYNTATHIFNGKIQTATITAPTNILQLSYLNSGNHLEVPTEMSTGTIVDFHSNPAATDLQYMDYDS